MNRITPLEEKDAYKWQRGEEFIGLVSIKSNFSSVGFADST